MSSHDRNSRAGRGAKRSMLALALCALGVGLVACGPDYDRIEITGVRQSPLGGDVKATRISVPEGMIVKAHVVPYDDDNETMGADVRARDPGIIDVTAIVNDRDYAFIGLKPGRTQVEFLAEGKVVLVVEAEVSEQTATQR